MQDNNLCVPILQEVGSGTQKNQTVLYKNRFLYSKYAPAKAICNTISRLTILEGTLILLNSPCLWYGLKELINILPKNCYILALEAEKELLNLSSEALKDLCARENLNLKQRLILLDANNTSFIDSHLRNLANTGEYKRAIYIDFSAGATFNSSLYKTIYSAASDIVSTFWKNRITLVRMGKLYSINIFHNLLNISNCLDKKNVPLSCVFHTIDKPILVCGAGEGLDKTLEDKNLQESIRQNKFYILAVDAAMVPLINRNLPVNGTVSVEPQFAIQKAYLGAKNYGSKNNNFTLFADLCSRPSIMRILDCNTVWFLSNYAESNFLKRIESSILSSSLIAPMGSVGLVATYIAIALRSDPDIPIYVTGMDFSYSIGLTHAKDTAAFNRMTFCQSKVNPLGNYAASFGEGGIQLLSKNKNKVSTNAIMLSYAKQFADFFSNCKNIFDISPTGIDLALKSYQINTKNIPQNKKVCHSSKRYSNVHQNDVRYSDVCHSDVCQNLNLQMRNLVAHNGVQPAEIPTLSKNFLTEEKQSLIVIRDLLSKGEMSEYRAKGVTLQEQLETMLKIREYLFLHFPDGSKLCMESSFLKRVRAEIDTFLKALAPL